METHKHCKPKERGIAIFFSAFYVFLPLPLYHNYTRPLSSPKTPLMLAVQVDSVDCVKLLCMAGANINLTDHKENTAVHIAAKKKHSKCLQALLSVQPVKETLKREINLNKKNDDGKFCSNFILVNVLNNIQWQLYVWSVT